MPKFLAGAVVTSDMAWLVAAHSLRFKRRTVTNAICLLSLLLTICGSAFAKTNSPPVAVNDNYSHVHRRLEVNDAGFLANDYDPDDPNEYLTLYGGNGQWRTQHGYVYLYRGPFIYAPDFGFTGQDSYVYTICDSQNACASATMTFDVENSAPVATNDSYTVHRRLDGAGTNFLSNDSDPEGDPVHLLVGTNGCRYTTQGGWLCLYDGSFSYAPAFSFTGTDNYTFTVCDDLGACSNETLTFDVVNRPSPATADFYTARGRIDVPAPGILGNDGNDPDGDQSRTLKLHGLPTNGLSTTAYGFISVWGDGSLSYTPTSGFTGIDFVQYTLCDDLGACSAATIYVFVPGSAPDPPQSCACPLDGAASGAGGSSVDDPVNLASGKEDYRPDSDLTVYNPNGPGVGWQREYHGYQASAGYGSPGLSLGWTHGYDLSIQGTPGAWGAVNLSYPNGAIESLSPQLDGSGQPTGTLTTPPGSAYVAQGVPGASAGVWQSLTITWKDQTQWRFTPLSSGVYALSQMTNRVGRSVNLSWRASDRALLQVSDASSNTTLLSLAYGSDGKLSSVTDIDGRHVAYSFSTASGTDPGKLQTVSQVADAEAASPPARWSYTYNSSADQQLHTITVPSATGSGNATATLNYDASGKVSSLVDANGNQRVYTYGAGGTQVQIKNAAGSVLASWMRNINTDGHDAGSTDANNQSTIREYNDALNRSKPTRVTDKNGKVTTLTYDGYGNVLSVTTPRGVATVYTYSYAAFALGRLTSVKEGSKPATTIAYFEPSGLVQSVTSPSPASSGMVTTSYTYDSLGNVLTATGPGNDAASQITTTLNYTTDNTYSQTAKMGQPLTVTDNLGHVSHRRYDTQGRVISDEDALGNETNLSYNVVGQLDTATLPATGQTGTGRGQRVSAYLYPGGPLATSAIYDESGAQSWLVSTFYGLEGETLSVAGSTEPVSYTYDALYRLKTLKDGKNNQTTYNYNSVGQLESVQMPGGESVQFPLHDANGAVLRRIDPNSVVTNYLYDDAENQLTDIQYAATPAANVHLGYDSFGRRTSMTDATGSHTYSYNNLDMLQSVTTTYTGVSPQTISYTFNPDGSRRTMATPAGMFSYAYDAAGRPSSMTNPFTETTSWAYFNNDRLQTQTLGNGATTTDTYSAAGQLIALANKNMLGVVLSQFSAITYDGASNRTSITASIPAAPTLSGTNSYQYDGKNQLTQEQTTRSGGYTDPFGYDLAGNPTTFKGAAQSFNANNQRTGAGFEHDGNGNPTSYNGVALSFDAENRLTSYGSVLTAGYTGDGLRAWKQSASGRMKAWKQSASGRTYFLYDDTVAVVELDSTGAVTATNTFGASGLVSRHTGSQSTFYTFDPQGSVSQRIDAGGTVLSNHLFKAHGGAVTTASADPFGFGAQWGYYTDSETGLQLLTHRYYDPQAGRFVTRDPIGYRGGVNLYAYARNTPLHYADPSGLSIWGITGGGSAFAGVEEFSVGGSASGTLWMKGQRRCRCTEGGDENGGVSGSYGGLFFPATPQGANGGRKGVFGAMAGIGGGVSWSPDFNYLDDISGKSDSGIFSLGPYSLQVDSMAKGNVYTLAASKAWGFGYASFTSYTEVNDCYSPTHYPLIPNGPVPSPGPTPTP